MDVGRSPRALLAIVAALITYAPSPTIAAESAPPAPRSITVVGVGRERAAPDSAQLQFSVEQHATTAEAASQAAARTTERVLEALQKLVGPGGKVETAGFSLVPVYKPEPQGGVPRGRGPEIIGYTATHDIWVQTRRMDAVGALIDGAIAAGAARIGQLAFTLQDPAPVQARALKTAGTDAAAQAAAVAEALHVRVTQVLEATTEAVPRPVPQRYAGGMRAEMAMVQTPIEPGEVTTEARLTVTYGIE